MKPSRESLSLTFDLRHPPAKVWRALTDPELLRAWLLPVTGFEPVPGAEFHLQAPPMPGWDGRVDCRVLDVQVHQSLRYTWVVGDLHTVVTLTLVPQPGGTRLLIEQTGFTEAQKHNLAGARYGWRTMGARLEHLLEQP